MRLFKSKPKEPEPSLEEIAVQLANPDKLPQTPTEFFLSVMEIISVREQYLRENRERYKRTWGYWLRGAVNGLFLSLFGVFWVVAFRGASLTAGFWWFFAGSGLLLLLMEIGREQPADLNTEYKLKNSYEKKIPPR
ncbi:MAG: hypothetical protein ACREQI_13355 [Candidatus Binataceae bacterium]